MLLLAARSINMYLLLYMLLYILRCHNRAGTLRYAAPASIRARPCSILNLHFRMKLGYPGHARLSTVVVPLCLAPEDAELYLQHCYHAFRIALAKQRSTRRHAVHAAVPELRARAVLHCKATLLQR
eukprot:TRINITY_DN17174_c0_g1_i1.p1 TRINITY_DN17174_c0_g1~~TRINITY_DN17174_c0_g1_i1.p1  ORF type:complete len:126 (-),score=3.81 TRINITY_DN17174_c0_g1_i1:131-508(-)